MRKTVQKILRNRQHTLLFLFEIEINDTKLNNFKFVVQMLKGFKLCEKSLY